MQKWIEKVLSKQAFEKATELVQAQPQASTPEEGAANHRRVVDGLIAFIEDLDDRVELIPYAGPILKALVDSPPFDEQERRLAEFIAESAYRALKYADGLGEKGAGFR